MNTYYIFNVSDNYILPDGISYYKGVTYKNCDYQRYFEQNPKRWRQYSLQNWSPKTQITFTNYERYSWIKTNSNPLVRHISNKGNLALLIKGERYQPTTFVFKMGEFPIGWNPEPNSLWFLKKASDLTFGGFDVFPIIHKNDIMETMKRISECIQESNVHKKYFSDTFVLQQGIRYPMLIEPEKRKYDMRCYGLLVTVGFGAPMEYYLFRKYLVRKSMSVYNPDSTEIDVMLTNTTQAKESGIDISSVTELRSDSSDPFEFNQIYQAYVDLCQRRLRPLEKDFQTFKNPSISIIGLDFIIDSDFKPYLLEINKSPVIHCDEIPRTKYHHGLEDDMFASDFFEITFESIFKKQPYKYSTENYHHVDMD